MRSVLSQNYENCEVIVSVNHSSDDSLEVLKQFKDPRLKVIIPPEFMSMTRHFEWILKHAQGEWIAQIGDDDGVMPYFFEEVEKVLKRHPKMRAISSHQAYYNWDGVQDSHGKSVLSWGIAPKERVVNGKWMLLLVMGMQLSFKWLPMLYANSVIHISVIRDLLQKSGGQFYHEVAPDVYSGVAIAASIKRYLISPYPLFWMGVSPKSNGLAVVMTEQGLGTKDMQARSSEFMKMSLQDGVSIASQVDERVWKYGLPSLFVYSALRKLPSKVALFEGKWLDYLVHTVFPKEIGRHRKRNEFEKAKKLEELYQIQIEKNKLSRFLLTLLSKGPCHFLKRIWRSSSKRVAKLKGRLALANCDHRLYSEDHALYPDLDAASRDVYKMYERSK